MLDICHSVAINLSITFNTDKSFCIAIGKMSKICIKPMRLYRDQIEWTTSISYLSVTVKAGTALSCDACRMRLSFFSASNCIYAQAKNLDEILHLKLQDTYCLSILTYAIAVMKLTVRQVDELNVCWNSVYRNFRISQVGIFQVFYMWCIKSFRLAPFDNSSTSKVFNLMHVF